MDKVYGNACCNIAAEDESEARVHLFRDRDPSQVTSYAVEVDCTDISPRIPTRHRLRADWFHRGSELLSTLARRGWVYQERFLSFRIVHFGANEICWTCQELLASETFPEGQPPPTVGSTDNERPILRDVENTITDRMTFFHHIWPAIVTHYSTCRLTFESDYLQALAGIGKFCQRLHDDKYLFGSWYSSLPQALLWRLANDAIYIGDAGRQLDLAPSWAWASVRTRTGIRFGQTRVQKPPLAKFVDYSLLTGDHRLSDHEATQIALQGVGKDHRDYGFRPTLRLSGHLWQTILPEVLGSDTPPDSDMQGNDEVRDQDEEKRPAWVLLQPLERGEMDAYSIILDEVVETPQTVTCLPISKEASKGRDEELGLILIGVECHEQNTDGQATYR